jgi:hypothetical protein
MRSWSFLLLLVISSSAFADEYVNGYVTSNGRIVQPHYRTSPNGYQGDNYSAPGNTNPYHPAPAPIVVPQPVRPTTLTPLDYQNKPQPFNR